MHNSQLLDALLHLPAIWLIQPSPDARWAAWTWWHRHPVATVYAVPTDGSQPPLRLSFGEHNAMLVSWAPDSRSIIYMSDRDGNERYQLFRVFLDDPQRAIPLTEADPPFYLRGGMLHPDGRTLLYAANYDFARGVEIEPFWIYAHDLETGQRRVLARPQKPCSLPPRWNRQGTHVLYNRSDRHPNGLQLWTVNADGSDDRELLHFGDDKQVLGGWLTDGERIVFRAGAEEHFRIGLWSPDEGVRWLIDDPERNPERLIIPENDGSVFVVLENHHARQYAALQYVDADLEVDLPELHGTLTPCAPLDDGEHWVGLYYSSIHPADVVRFSPARPEEMQSLARIWETTPLTEDDLTPAEDLRWHARDGLEIQGWLYRARGKARGTVVYVHGGPTWHLEDKIDAEIQFYAASGFNVLVPNYRGSTGFSRAYQEAIKVDGWGGAEQDDIRAGIEVLLKAGIAQPGRVAITGTSYGGYSSWCAITRWPPQVIAAAAPVCGMTDLIVDYETTRPDLRPYSEAMMGGSPSEIPDKYRERSPIYHVHNIRGHLLIVQGMQDPNVTPENLHTVTDALEEHNIPYETLLFDDEGHGIDRLENRRALYTRLVDFFAEAFAAHSP